MMPNEFELFANIKREMIKGGMPEEMFNDFISELELKLRLTFFDISSSLLHQAVTVWIMLQVQFKKDKISFLATSKTPTTTPPLRCLLCDTYPVVASSYIDKNQPRALFYFVCDDHYIGSAVEEEKKHNLMKDVEDLADQFYIMRKEMGLPN